MPSSRICGCTRRSSRMRSIVSAGACGRAAPPAAPRCRGGPDETPADRIPVQAPYGAGHVSIFPKTLQMLADAGVVVDVIAGNGRLIDLSSVRVEHDLYVVEQISGIPLS